MTTPFSEPVMNDSTDDYPFTVVELAREPAADPDDLFAHPRRGYSLRGQLFYPIGVLAKALGRKPVTIRKWESDGWLPRAHYRSTAMQGNGKSRLYTREHIEGIVQIANEEGVLDRSRSLPETNFTARVVTLFTELDRKYRD